MAWETFGGQSGGGGGNPVSSIFDWRNSIIGFVDFTTAEPTTPSANDRYINTVTGASNVTAQAVTQNRVYQWNGASWTESAPMTGWVITNKTTTELFGYTGTSWVSVATPAGAAVTSFNTRTGAVVPQGGDYTAAQITNFDSQALTATEKSNLATGFSVSGGTSSKTLTVQDNVELNQSVKTTDSPTFSTVTLSSETNGFLKTDGAGLVSVEEIDLVSSTKDGLQPQSNRTASAPPTVTDDINSGYKVGSYWVDSVADKAYICANNDAGAAIWVDITQSGGGGAGVSSFNARTGAVIPQSNDYNASQISNFDSQALTAVEKNNLATGFTVSGGTTSKTLTVSENSTINQSLQTTDAPTFTTATLTGATNGFLKTDGAGLISSDSLSLVSSSGDGLQPQSNRAGMAAPTTGDDSSQGYKQGSYWIDTASNKAYVCVDDSLGAALWVETTQSGGGGGLPLTTKGDIVTYSASNVRLGIGPDNSIFTADSGEVTGNAWKDTISLTSGDIGNISFNGNILKNKVSGEKLLFQVTESPTPVIGDFFRFQGPIGLFSPTAPVDQKLITFENDVSGIFSINVYQDDFTTSSPIFRIIRAGFTVSSTEMLGNILNPSGILIGAQINTPPTLANSRTILYNNSADDRFYGQLRTSAGDLVTNKIAYEADFANTKGQLLTADNSNNPTRFSVGTDNQILSAKDSEGTGLLWTSVLRSLSYIDSTFYKSNEAESGQTSANIVVRNNANYFDAGRTNWITFKGEKNGANELATYAAIRANKTIANENVRNGDLTFYINDGTSDDALLEVFKASNVGETRIKGATPVIWDGYVDPNTIPNFNITGNATVVTDQNANYIRLANISSELGSFTFETPSPKGEHYTVMIGAKINDPSTIKGNLVVALDHGQDFIVGPTDTNLQYNLFFDFNADIVSLRHQQTLVPGASLTGIGSLRDNNTFVILIRRSGSFFDISIRGQGTIALNICAPHFLNSANGDNRIGVYGEGGNNGGSAIDYRIFSLEVNSGLRQQNT